MGERLYHHYHPRNSSKYIFSQQLTLNIPLCRYAVSDYVSTIWATSLVVACVLAHEEATQKHSELVAAAREWLASETERHGFDGTEKWIKKANDYLVAILN